VIPYEDLVGARDATARLIAHLDDVPAVALSVPSRLPGWTRAHVVAHLAGNALSHVRMLDGCLAGEVRAQYEGGAAAREAAIEELAADPAAAVEEHRQACAALDQRWERMQPAHWERDVLWLDGGTAPALTTLWSRWKEVEIHRVDLGAEYEPADWAPSFSARLREQLLDRTGMRAVVQDRVRAADAAVAAWLCGRSDGADLDLLGSGTLPVPPPWT
jgi:maleylpyruvate isomerase